MKASRQFDTLPKPNQIKGSNVKAMDIRVSNALICITVNILQSRIRYVESHKISALGMENSMPKMLKYSHVITAESILSAGRDSVIIGITGAANTAVCHTFKVYFKDESI